MDNSIGTISPLIRPEGWHLATQATEIRFSFAVIYVWLRASMVIFLRALLLLGLFYTDVLAEAGSIFSDPLHPDEHIVERPVETPFYKIMGRLGALEQEIQSKEDELAALPPLQNATQSNAYGYHSSYLPKLGLSEALRKPRWSLEFGTLKKDGKLDLVLVPAVSPQGTELKGYGFPKRFRVVSADPDKPTEVYVDWTQADFPNPGRRPVYFHLPESDVRRVRLEVFSGQVKNESEFFSLARIYCIRANESLRLRNLVASSSFELLPYWSKNYLGDERFTTGLPIAPSKQSGEDFVFKLGEGQADRRITLEIDLADHRQHGWVYLYPALSTSGPRVPGYGFPGQIKMEYVTERNDGGYGKARQFYQNDSFASPGDNLIRIASRGRTGRWLRIHMSDFPIYEDQAVFALSEIEVIKEGTRQSRNQPVRLMIENEMIEADTSLLVDGLAGGQAVLPLDKWFQGLAAGKAVEKSLLRLKSEQEELGRRRGDLLKNAAIAGGFIFLFVVLSVIFLSSRKRKRESLKLRRQITQDLHDDVGSRISAMSLAATYLKKVSSESMVQNRAGKIERMAREMQVALSDVLWFTDTQTDSLRELVHRLSEIAQQSLPSELLVIDQTSEKKIPNTPVNATFKRDLLMIFKEMLSNASKHSEASEIQVGLQWQRPCLIISVSDNGKGFDVSQAKQQQRQRPHLGLNSMERRAKRLGASFQIDSQHGAGSRISLTVKI